MENLSILNRTNHTRTRCATYEKRTSEIHYSTNNLYFECSFNGILSEYNYERNLANFDSFVFNRTYPFARKKTDYNTKTASDFFTANSNI